MGIGSSHANEVAILQAMAVQQLVTVIAIHLDLLKLSKAAIIDRYGASEVV